MSLPNSDIRHFDPAPGFGGTWLFPIQDPVSGKTYKIPVSNFTPSGSDINNIAWTGTNTPGYAEDDIVTFAGDIWQSLEDNNLNNIPTEGVWWTKLTKAPSGFVLWQAGVVTSVEAYCLHDVNGLIQLFRLAPSVSRPFNSTNFYNEYALDKWELMSERGYTVIHKPASGWVVGQVLQISTGDWNTFDGTANPLGIVRYIIDADYALAVLIGSKDKNYTGLVPFSYYYAQNDGTYGTSITDFLLFVSLSDTDVILLGNGVGFVPVIGAGDWDSRGLWDFSIDQFPQTGGSGSGGSIKQGDTWDISFSSIGLTNPLTGDPYYAGGTLRALVDNPGEFATTDWTVMY